MALKLHHLGEAFGVPLRTLQRWRDAGVIRGRQLGRGRGRGLLLSRDDALEVAALLLLRRSGLPFAKVRQLARQFQRDGRVGRDFFAVGAYGRHLLLDGAGDNVPLHPASGQGLLFPLGIDLREMRPQLEKFVDDLERATAQGSTREGSQHARSA